MPSYFYHLKFELYPTPPLGSGLNTKTAIQRDRPIWTPKNHSSIFDELPSHPRSPSTSPSDKPQRPQSHTQPKPPVSLPLGPDNSLIDCGSSRAEHGCYERNIVILSETQLRQRTLNFLPQQPGTAINPQTAVKDWRFGRVNVESIDFDGYRNSKRGDAMQQTSTSTAALTVGPSMGTAGKATKAKYVPLVTAKNTEFGWGIVHLYREGSKTHELSLPPQEEPQGEQDEDRIDCTTVCIPAVPSYLSPSDFLGFIGEKWRDQISHYRMVMTGRMNRYLVLMKFRDSNKARLFGREFDGMVFNPIEVWMPPHLHRTVG
jgi:BRCA1-associated protein